MEALSKASKFKVGDQVIVKFKGFQYHQSLNGKIGQIISELSEVPNQVFGGESYFVRFYNLPVYGDVHFESKDLEAIS